MMKYFPLLLLSIVLNICAYSQSVPGLPNDGFEFSQITFHSTECNGTCPDISLNIYANKTIELSRTIYKLKGNPDTTKSGNFKGQLEIKEYNRLIALLKQVSWDTITFPEVTCCDKPLKTIILSYNDKYKRYKSMEPPKVTNELIVYLMQLGTTIKLPVYEKPIDFEM